MNFSNLKSLPLAEKIKAINTMDQWACNLQINGEAINRALELMGSDRRLGYEHGYQNLGVNNASAASQYFWFVKGSNLHDHRNTKFFDPKNWKEALTHILSA